MAFTEEHYAAYEKFICQKFDLHVVDRNDVPKIRELARIIDVIRLFAPNMPKGDEWIEQWSFAFANMLLLAKIEDPIARAETLAHEAQHGVQWHRRTQQADVPPHFSFWWLYLVEQEARVRLEVEAFRAGFEIEAMLTGKVREAPEVGRILEGGYLLSEEQAKFAQRLYEPAELAMFHGTYSTVVARESRAFFLENNIPLAV